MMADMTKKRIRLNDRQCRLFLKDVREFGYNETFAGIREIANQIAEGTAAPGDPVALMMAGQIDEATAAIEKLNRSGTHG